MIDLSLPLVLASGSPRRRELLETIHLPFTVDVSDADEEAQGAPEEIVKTLSLRKAQAIFARHENSIILGADTIVYLDTVLGKPLTAEHAKEMLTILSGRWHDVYTGVTLVNTRTGKVLTRAERTRVHFLPISQSTIERYVATGEPLDKAGGYAIQGAGEAFIDRIEGSYSNVVGLPLACLTEMLEKI